MLSHTLACKRRRRWGSVFWRGLKSDRRERPVVPHLRLDLVPTLPPLSRNLTTSDQLTATLTNDSFELSATIRSRTDLEPVTTSDTDTESKNFVLPPCRFFFLPPESAWDTHADTLVRRSATVGESRSISFDLTECLSPSGTINTDCSQKYFLSDLSKWCLVSPTAQSPHLTEASTGDLTTRLVERQAEGPLIEAYYSIASLQETCRGRYSAGGSITSDLLPPISRPSTSTTLDSTIAGGFRTARESLDLGLVGGDTRTSENLLLARLRNRRINRDAGGSFSLMAMPSTEMNLRALDQLLPGLEKGTDPGGQTHRRLRALKERLTLTLRHSKLEPAKSSTRISKRCLPHRSRSPDATTVESLGVPDSSSISASSSQQIDVYLPPKRRFRLKLQDPWRRLRKRRQTKRSNKKAGRRKPGSNSVRLLMLTKRQWRRRKNGRAGKDMQPLFPQEDSSSIDPVETENDDELDAWSTFTIPRLSDPELEDPAPPVERLTDDVLRVSRSATTHGDAGLTDQSSEVCALREERPMGCLKLRHLLKRIFLPNKNHQNKRAYR